MLALACSSAAAAPSTFGTVIGSALLCRSHLENAYFHQYLTTAFGPAYKHEGGAFWFKLDASLWGKPVLEVMVSDDTSAMVFVGAVVDARPEELEEAIRVSAGLHHKARDGSAAPLRISNPGSVIAYQNGKSKIYCARYKPLPPGR
ncbi:hypothetical protein [Massilia sp. Se16.2.3]|uniref:hypothetical protein n=1 Tax=Massilia sp. Se16.2.3 TaxID=2709303 RepID=UPI001E655EAC|nr:hypothetical protein [Massilia sp. Se16.2.3]